MPDTTFSIASLNIQSGRRTPAHGRMVWKNRLALLSEALVTGDFDLLGFQEFQEACFAELAPVLDAQYDHWEGACTNNGNHNPVYWQKTRFEPVRKGFFWLSPTPDEPSRGWDAKYCRGATYVILRDRQHKIPGKHRYRRVVHLNTHFDHKGWEARIQSARLLVNRIRQLFPGLPVVISGDFNCGPYNPVLEAERTQFYSLPYNIIRGAGFMDAVLWLDEQLGCCDTPPYTYHGYKGESYVPDDFGTWYIDGVFASTPTFEWQASGVFRPRDDGLAPSDHDFPWGAFSYRN